MQAPPPPITMAPASSSQQSGSGIEKLVPLLHSKLLSAAAQNISPPTAPMDAPPTIAAPSMGTGQMPQKPSPMMPNVTKIPSQIDSDKANLVRMGDTGAGVSQLYGKIKDAMPNHPFVGKLLGGLAQGVGTLGDVGLKMFAPQLESAIPGTLGHHSLDMQQGLGRVKAEEEANTAEATQGEQHALTGQHQAETAQILPTAAREDARESSEEGLRGEQVKNLQSEEAERTSPSFTVHDTDEGPLLVGKDGTAQHLTVDGTPVGPKIKLTQSQPIMGTDGKPHTYMLDEQGNKKVDLGVHYERPNVTNINAGDKADAALKKQVYTAYTPVMDSAERFNVMAKNYEDGIKTHDQQAMLSLLYNHMGMTMGLQKGARMTQALIQEAQKSQPWLNNIKAKFDRDGYLTGVTLSPRQMQEMVHNAQGRFSEDAQKARNESQYLGAKDDGPERTPNASTINYYTSLANGDPNKAKQQAAQDGWMVK
jgi:hypothetical protein